MKALVCTQHGPPSSLTWGELDDPGIAKGALRIGVRAAGVNFPDTLIIEGKYQFQPPIPFAPGGEVAGVVLEVGEGVEGYAVGDRVMALTGWSGFAEQVVAPAFKCFRIPDGMDYATASAFGMTYGTSIYALVQRGGLQPGETLLVHGASGGVGTAAIQIGQAMGATVIASTGTPAKRDALRDTFGVEHVVDTRGETALKDAVKGVTGGRGADVIFDPVGGDVFEQSLRCVNWGGRILVIGFASGTIPAAKANLMLLKGSAVVGVFWGAFTMKEADANAKNFEQLFAWYEQGKLTPHISHQFPMAEGAKALDALINREVIGKAVLTLD
ncbi:MAG: NADPH:quinone oxidoreductase family protein [Myxococcota bacterium]